MEISKLNAAEPTATQSARSQAKPETNETSNEQVKNEGAAEMQKSVQVGEKEKYEAVSKDGDTLQLSEKSTTKLKIEKQLRIEDIGIKAPEISSKMSDATLAKYSSGKLKQLLSQGQISRQQYDKAMKKLNQ